jgi:hypothetical protein
LQNAPFCPISASGSNFNPQNTQCIPVVNPAKSGKHFSKVSETLGMVHNNEKDRAYQDPAFSCSVAPLSELRVTSSETEMVNGMR